MNPERDLLPTEPFGLIAWLKETRVALPLKGVECRFEATGPLLHVEIDQIFHQEHAEALDCLYTFPLPAGAAVYRCEMHVNERVISARIEEREKARKIYREQKAAGRRAALVESERDNLFTLSLGNLQPGDLVVVRLAYAQVLERLGGELRARIPVCPGVRYIPGQPLLRDLSGRGSVDDTDQVPDASRLTPPRIDALHPDAAYFAVSGKVAASDVADGTLSSPTHPILTRREDDLQLVELADRGAVPDRDLVVRWEEPVATSLRSQGWEFPCGNESFCLLSLRAPEQVSAPENFAQDFYFLVDRSGSMEGAKWQQACAALREFVNLLGPDDRVWITMFETDFRDFAESPQTATALKGDRGFLQLARLGVAGSTELLPAVRHVAKAMKKHSKGRRAVAIVLTDGQIGNESAVVAEFANTAVAAVHTFGIDTAVNDAFLRELARKTGGECWLLTPNDDVAGTVAKLGYRLRRPALSDLKMSGKFETARTRLPDLFSGQAADITLRGPAKHGTLEIAGRIAGGAAQKVALDLAGSTNPALRLIWGRDRIEALWDAGNEKAAIALAKDFNLLCRGVAFVAWDESEKVVIAEREIYQPSEDIQRMSVHCCSVMADASIDFLMSAPSDEDIAGRGLHRNYSSVLNEPFFEPKHCMGAPKSGARPPLAGETLLGNALEFFHFHRPELVSENRLLTHGPLTPVLSGQALWEWIENMLAHRGAGTDCARAIVAWLESEFGDDVAAWPLREAPFVDWVFQGADQNLSDSAFASLTKALVDARPPSETADLQMLQQEIERWIEGLASIAAHSGKP